MACGVSLEGFLETVNEVPLLGGQVYRGFHHHAAKEVPA
jgi:hypothetical protein